MARLIVKNGHPKDMRHHEIQLCAQNIDTIVGSVVNITIGGGGVYMIALNTKRIFALTVYNFRISSQTLKHKMAFFGIHHKPIAELIKDFKIWSWKCPQ